MSNKFELNAEGIKTLVAKGTVITDMKDYSGDPFFQAKVKAAKKRLDKIKIPDTLISKG